MLLDITYRIYRTYREGNHRRQLLPLCFLILLISHTSNGLASSPTIGIIDDFTKCYKEPEAIYVHIPFCRRRCYYCDFAVVPVGDRPKQSGDETAFETMVNTYSTAVQHEIKLLKRICDQRRSNKGNLYPLRSIYFGGGTPSIAPFHIIRDILHSILDSFEVDDNAEITIEMDPGTFSRDQLSELISIGFNRVSLGVQSFDDSILESIGRVHRSKDIATAIDILNNEGINNFSIDLISGLPGLDLAKWIETLDIATSLNPSHISCYDLQIEESTPFFKWFGKSVNEDDFIATAPQGVSNRKLPVGALPCADDVAFMYKYASGYLRKKGFEHYEISSYCKPGFRSRHNTLYWEIGASWFAVGQAASSSLSGLRFARPRKLADYVEWVTGQERLSDSTSWNPDWTSKSHDRQNSMDFLMDMLLTRLRTSEGIELAIIRQYYGDVILNDILRGSKLALDLNLAVIQNDCLRLTDPDGFLFSNQIISNIFTEISELEI